MTWKLKTKLTRSKFEQRISFILHTTWDQIQVADVHIVQIIKIYLNQPKTELGCCFGEPVHNSSAECLCDECEQKLTNLCSHLFISGLYLALEELEKLRASSVSTAVIDQTYYSGEDDDDDEEEIVTEDAAPVEAEVGAHNTPTSTCILLVMIFCPSHVYHNKLHIFYCIFG